MSRFVSAGAINAETGEAVTQDATDNTTTTNTNSGGGGTKSAAEAKKSAEWDLVQKELDAERKRREEARVKSVEGGEKSLYDVLQANKAAKQAAFEEANKIRNQFRALDDDEIGFLDEVREAKRAEEERVRRETEEGLVAFRRAQGGGLGVKRAGDGEEDVETDAAAPVDGGDGGDGEWAVGPRKRRRKERERGFGVKKEKGGEDKVDDKKMEDTADAEKGAVKASSTGAAATATTSTTATAAPVKGKLSLVAYGSDSDDE
ncbi:Nefa-interacting nuclear protein [Colletotrichum scovillei]|uniref:Nefa-interacting nuclear protein n=1 Tax=Colletotrichum scovillei TaxID=1209932 RepID=A0A9P7UCD2_9PEZI|nr:Nefa-interacting nuclear protein [Colletotrichum scovillei]KAG7068965.1 Nefa-interacting nuclear protein [Colletotrichum scovillei]KAG7072916.1 Nefa-interacting nuclear protein [Colletotrichum scovillei]